MFNAARFFVLATAIASFVAITACDDEDSSDYEAARVRCVDKINSLRAQESLVPLERWTEVESCVDKEAEILATEGTNEAGRCSETASSECQGWSSTDDIVDNCLQNMWDQGPGSNFDQHGDYISMSDVQHTQVTCGFYENSYGVWAVINYR